MHVSKDWRKNIQLCYVFPSVSKCPSLSLEIIKWFRSRISQDIWKILKYQNNHLESKNIGEKCTWPSKSIRALFEQFENNASIKLFLFRRNWYNTCRQCAYLRLGGYCWYSCSDLKSFTTTQGTWSRKNIH